RACPLIQLDQLVHLIARQLIAPRLGTLEDRVEVLPHRAPFRDERFDIHSICRFFTSIYALTASTPQSSAVESTTIAPCARSSRISSTRPSQRSRATSVRDSSSRFDGRNSASARRSRSLSVTKSGRCCGASIF